MNVRDEALVIGAGPAGISAAYYLQRVDIPYRVVDQAAVVGSTWADLYPSLQLNTLSLTSHLPSDRILLRYGAYPTGKQYHTYLRRYVEKHALNIALNVKVTRVVPDGTCWRVESSEGVALYRHVIVASGRFNHPYIPAIPGADTFAGTLIHAREFHNPAAYGGQRVIVVGTGPSGGDIASALATTDPAPVLPVLLAIRSDVVLARKYPLGVPHSIWQMGIRYLPERWRKPLMDRLVYAGYPGMKSLPIKFAPNRTDRIGSSAPIRGPELLRALQKGQVIGVTGLARLHAYEAELMDGSRHQVDTVILCTGYRPAVDYLDFPFERDPDGWMIRAIDPVFGVEGMEIDGYPGLFLVGRFYRGFGALRNFRHEAHITVEQIRRKRGEL